MSCFYCTGKGSKKRICGTCLGVLKVKDARARGSYEAHKITREAVEAGKFPDPKTLECNDCPRHADVYDHRDYNKPLEVDSVCFGCNKRRGSAKPVKGYKMAEILKLFFDGKIERIKNPGMKFKNNILKKLRENSSLTLDEVAEKVSCDKSSVSLWENGRRPGPRNLRRISDLFNVPISAFFALLFFVGSAAAEPGMIDLKVGEHQRIAPNFVAKEFWCRCAECRNGHAREELDGKLLYMLELLRVETGGRQIVISSGVRCSDRNRAVAGAPKSQHMRGKAADIVVKGMTPSQVASAARRVGFSFVKTYRTHTHVDVR